MWFLTNPSVIDVDGFLTRGPSPLQAERISAAPGLGLRRGVPSDLLEDPTNFFFKGSVFGFDNQQRWGNLE